MRELLQQITGVLVSRGGLKVINVLIILVAVRLLSVEDYGFYGVFVTTAGLMALLVSMGIRHSSAFLIAKMNKPPELVSGSVLALSCPLMVLAGYLTLQLCRPESTSAALDAGLAFGGGAFLLFTVHQGIFLGRGKLRWFNASEVMPKAVLLIAILCAAALPYSFQAAGIVWLYGIAYLVTTLLFIFLNARSLEGSLTFKPSLSREIFWRGIPFGVAVFLIMLNSKLALLQLNFKSLNTESGHFYSALQFTEIANEVGSAIGLVFFARSARSSNDHQTLLEAGRIISFLFWGSCLAGILGMLAAPYVVPILLGNSYVDAAPVLQILLLGLPFAVTSKVLYPTLAGLGRSTTGILVLIPCVLFQIALGWYLIERFGAEGAAWSLLASQAAVCAAYFISIRVIYGIHLRNFLLPDLGKIIREIRK